MMPARTFAARIAETCSKLLTRSGNNPSPTPPDLKSSWRDRVSSHAVDLSGVWRFRDLLPNLETDEQAVTLREGNTPVYELKQCARITGVPRLFAKHQGMNPTGSFKDTRYDCGGHFRAPRRISLGRMRLDRQYIRVDGGLRRPRRHA